MSRAPGSGVSSGPSTRTSSTSRSSFAKRSRTACSSDSRKRLTPSRIADMGQDERADLRRHTPREPALRHQVPIGIGDAFVYAESGGERIIVIGALELPRVRELPGLVVHTLDEYSVSSNERLAGGRARRMCTTRRTAAPCRRSGSRTPLVPHTFAVGFADRPARPRASSSRPINELFSRAPPRQERARAGGHPAGAGRGRGRYGCRPAELLRRAEPNGEVPSTSTAGR